MKTFFSKKKTWIGITVAVLIVGGLVAYCSSGSKSDVLADAPVPPSTDPIPEPELGEGDEQVSVIKQTVPEEKVKEPVVSDDSGIDYTDLRADPNGIGQFDPKKFRECAMPSGQGRFVMDDKAILFTYNKGSLRIVVYMGSGLFNDICQSDPLAKSEENSSMSRIEYAIVNRGKELTFYILPMLIIKKDDYNKMLKQIEIAKKSNPDREQNFILPFDTATDEIREAIANEINSRFGDGKQRYIMAEQIQTPDISDFTLYIKGKAFKGYRGEMLGITISGKPAELAEVFQPTVNYNGLSDLQMKVDYRITGEHIKRNLSVLTIRKLQQLENIHRYFQNKTADYKHKKYQHGGGFVLDLMKGTFGLSCDAGNKEQYDEQILVCYITEEDLKEFAQLIRTKIYQYTDQEFGDAPLSPIDFELRELTTSLESKVIKINPDGTIENKDLLDQYLAQLVEKINDDQDTLNRVKQLIPEQRAAGMIKITADDLLSIDIIKKHFEQGVKVYKLDRKTITDTYNHMQASSTHVFGSYYPVSASAIALSGTTPAEIAQDFVTMDPKNSILSRGIAGTVDSDSKVPTDGKWYFVTTNYSANKQTSNIWDLLFGNPPKDYCLGHSSKSRTTFTISIGDIKYDRKGGVTAVMTGKISSNSCCGYYIIKVELAGAIDPSVPYFDKVRVGSVLSKPQAASMADVGDIGVYASVSHEVSTARKKGKFAGSLTSERSYSHFQKGDRLRSGKGLPYLGGYLYASHIPAWYRSAYHAPFEVNVNYEYYDENGVKHIKTVFSKNVKFFGEYHFAWVEDTRDRWDKFWGIKSFSIHEPCETRYRVGWCLTDDAEISIPFTYEVKPSTFELTVIGSVGGNAHVRLNSEKQFEPMSFSDYETRSKQVQNSLK